jgi:hypothetical protein
MSDIRQFFGEKANTFGDPLITLPFQNTRTGFRFVVRLSPEFDWFKKLEGNIYTQLENIIKCFKEILQREDPKARNYIEANNWTDIFIKCPFHYDIDKDISADRPHLTALVNGDLNAFHFYATKNCRAFTNLTRKIIESIDWSWADPPIAPRLDPQNAPFKYRGWVGQRGYLDSSSDEGSLK